MKVVINDTWGGYYVPEEVREELGCGEFDDTMEIRTNVVFWGWVFNHSDDTDLAVYEMPDDATDYMITENDGWETLYYVKGGKIYTADIASY